MRRAFRFLRSLKSGFDEDDSFQDLVENKSIIP